VDGKSNVLVCETASGQQRLTMAEDRNRSIPVPPSTSILGGPGIALAFSPDGRLLATSNYHFVIRIWDTLTGKEVTTLR
jgi:WD40 repeat protein